MVLRYGIIILQGIATGIAMGIKIRGIGYYHSGVLIKEGIGIAALAQEKTINSVKCRYV